MVEQISTCNTCSNKGGETCSACDEVKKGNKLSDVKHVIAVMSGKGGVGKSTVASLLAVALQKKGFKTGILDADITGPSIPKLFGIKKMLDATEVGIFPVKSKLGISIMSINLLLQSEDDPVIWRGPVIAGAIKQFWEEVIWGNLDYLIVDLPPGTGDAPLTVMQSLPLESVVIVTSPQDLASMIVRKTMKMAQKMETPILGIIENMSYLECAGCGKRVYPFGKGKTDLIAQEYEIPLLGVLPLEPLTSNLGDEGKIEESESYHFLNINVLFS